MDKIIKNFIFDVDGTLSPARKKASSNMGALLRDLSKIGKISIVSGSDFDFINEQLESVWVYLPCDEVVVFGCNGTKKYIWKKGSPWNSKFVLDKELSMRKQIGKESFLEILKFLTIEQSSFLEIENISTFCSGQFFSYRGSMLNWSPIGRNNDPNDREAFVKFDKDSGFRKKTLEKVVNFLSEKKIEVKVSLGGDTSFDIFPKGWDKTLALSQIQNGENYFFGDKCNKGGNDYEIYKKVKESGGHAYHVKNPDETESIIKKIIKENL